MEFKCLCGSDRVVLEDRGVHKAIICEECGKYIKFATKEEIRFINKKKREEIDTEKYNEEEVKLSFAKAFGFIQNPITCNEVGMRLAHWKDDVIIKVQYPDGDSKMTAPYLYIESRFGRVPWIPTQPELFSREWIIVF